MLWSQTNKKQKNQQEQLAIHCKRPVIMALSSPNSPRILTTSSQFSTNSAIPKFTALYFSSKPTTNNNNHTNFLNLSNNKNSSFDKWRAEVSFFPAFLKKGKDAKVLKEELFEAIAPLDRGAEANLEDQQRVDEIARQLEAVNPTKEPLKSNLLNGKWELIYTTSQSILQTQRPKFLRPNGKIFQAINLDTVRAQNMETWPFFIQRPKFLRPNGKIFQAINLDTLRAQNMETWPFFNQVTANLVTLNARKVAVKFDFFRIAGLIPIASPGSGRGQLEITYLDEELRISRGDRGNLFILKMVDPSYRVPL